MMDISEEYTDFTERDIIGLVVQDGREYSIYRTDLGPDEGAVTFPDGMGYPVTWIRAVRVPGEGAFVPWFDIYVDRKLHTTVNRRFVVQIMYSTEEFAPADARADVTNYGGSE